MKLLIKASNVISSCIDKNYKPECYEIEYNMKSTLKQIRELIGAPQCGISYDRYYVYYSNCFINNEIPYIIINNQLRFNANLDSILIDDFIKTHNIKNNCICIEYGIALAGGPTLIDWIKVWEMVGSIINAISVFGGFIAFIDFIKRYFEKEKTYPHAMMDFLYKRNLWNHNELAGLLRMSKDDVKLLLKLYGYKWDNSKKLYYIDKSTKKSYVKRIGKVRFYE